ncbi:DUF1830 domain-containing protein [Roseofilum casamattae]|uniref:DUF1830 domain-containing protein n=1 Tax=Roseofilum casamattae BLCC-M143 TaxID=3022442 RepID=A0ABT7BVN1_9CYAN|nr:DUF1830 domain-containing protein [Roseofilum casamattae]MDJ1183251.1 DUF1830 domain-containing protein [Roseofilum casamattae BLCC-M143]
MSQIIDPLSNLASRSTVCSYKNVSPLIQIARISNISGWYFERVIFPQEYLLFEAPLTAKLEIYQKDNNGIVARITEIPCDRLAVVEAEAVIA